MDDTILGKAFFIPQINVSRGGFNDKLNDSVVSIQFEISVSIPIAIKTEVCLYSLNSAYNQFL